MIVKNKMRGLAKLALDVVLSSVLIGVCIYLYSIAVLAPENEHLFWQAGFFFFLAVVFLAACFYSNFVTLLRLIRWVCVTISFPRGSYMTIVYAGLFGMIGLIQISRWVFEG